MRITSALRPSAVLGLAALVLSGGLSAVAASPAAGATRAAGAVPAVALPPPAAPPRAAASAENDALAQQIVQEVNRARTNPAEFAQRLEALEKSRVDAGHVKLPDGGTIQASAGYLANAIAAAKSQQPLKPLTWSAGMAKVTQAFADTNPPGHFATGSRFEPAGDWNDIKEAIGWDNTALAFTYDFYISEGEATPGHRGIVDAPAFTQISVGCDPSSRYSGATTICVLNTAMNWTDKGSPPNPAAFAAPGLSGLTAPIGGSVGATVPANRIPLTVDLAAPVRILPAPINPVRIPPLVSVPSSGSSTQGSSTPGSSTPGGSSANSGTASGCSAADTAAIADAQAADALRCVINQGRIAAGLKALTSNGPLDQLTATYAAGNGNIGNADEQNSLCPAGKNVSGYKGYANTLTARDASKQISLKDLTTNSPTAYLGVDAKTQAGFGGKQFAVILVICQ